MAEPTNEQMAAAYGLPVPQFLRAVSIRRESILADAEIAWNDCIRQAMRDADTYASASPDAQKATP